MATDTTYLIVGASLDPTLGCSPTAAALTRRCSYAWWSERESNLERGQGLVQAQERFPPSHITQQAYGTYRDLGVGLTVAGRVVTIPCR
jgi:hypothetical protein